MRRALLLLLPLPVFAYADDGFLNASGVPRLMSAHPSIHMVCERVVVTIRPQGYHVEATFTFRNEGGAQTVRMGFPDNGSDDQNGPTDPAVSSLKGFCSWVGGMAVPTTLIRNVKDNTVWRVKRVAFNQGQTRQVRVAYDADGGGATNSDPRKYLRHAQYTMHTGASWKGPIEYAELIVSFSPGTLVGPIKPISSANVKDGDPYGLTDWAKRPKGTVFWSGFAKPNVVGREMRFVRRRFEPGKDDDLNVYFGYGHRFD